MNQRAFSGARFSSHKDLFAGRDDRLRTVDRQLAIVQCDVELSKIHAIVRTHAQLDGLARRDGSEVRLQTLDRIRQLRHAVRGGEPIGQTHRIVGKPVQRELDLNKRRGSLHQRAERHLA